MVSNILMPDVVHLARTMRPTARSNAARVRSGRLQWNHRYMCPSAFKHVRSSMCKIRDADLWISYPGSIVLHGSRIRDGVRVTGHCAITRAIMTSGRPPENSGAAAQ